MKETDSTVRNPKKIEENCFTTYFNNAFQQQKKALNKRTRFESNPKPVNTSRNEWFDENPISTSRKKLLPLNLGKWFQRAGMFFFKNWPTFIFKNGVHYRKKKLWINAKGLQLTKKPFPIAGMKDSLKNTISQDRKTASIWNSVWKNWIKRFTPAKIRFCEKYCPYSNGNNGFKKKYEWKKSFPIKKKIICHWP